MTAAGTPRWPGHGPWDEVWFLEGVDEQGAGFWFRVTLSDGVVPRAETWAVWDGPRREVGHDTRPLEALRIGASPWIAGADGLHLDGTKFRGRAGPIAWDLDLDHAASAVPLVPPLLERLGVGRTYEPVRAACGVRGTVTLPDGPVEVRGRAVLGHLFGARSRVASWGWVHVPGFPGAPNVVFEALSARLGPGRGLPAISACTLQLEDEVVCFTSPLSLIRTRAHLDERHWTLRASRGARTLTATIRLPEDVVVAEYTAPDDRKTWCHNSTHVDVDLTFRDTRGVRHWRSPRALGELASRRRPTRRLDLP